MDPTGEPSKTPSRGPSDSPTTSRAGSARGRCNYRGRSKGKARARDERSFDDPESLRGIIQSLEEDRAKSSRLMEEMMASITRLAGTVNTQQQRLDTLEPSPNRPIPSVETATMPDVPRPRVTATGSYAPSSPRIGPDPSPIPINKPTSKLTEKIEPLNDGTSPTFRQWKISVRDRLVVNADHYPNNVTQKALIWGTVTGLAREYLEPRYQNPDQDFDTANEMLDTLESYFVTGFETDQNRNQFFDLKMEDKDHARESFPEFIARFRSKAILGGVHNADWFYHCWDKITPQLRNLAVASKHLWNQDFNQMVTSLTAMDLERRRNNERNPPNANRPGYNTTTRAPAGGGVSRTPRATPKPFRSESVPRGTSYRGPSKPPTDSTKATTPFPRKGSADPTSSVCYFCGEPGHFKAQCPNLPSIRMMIQEIDEGEEALEQSGVRTEEDTESDLIREGNEDA